MSHREYEHENFVQRNWHSITMVVFLAVVTLDLIILPLWTEYANTKLTAAQMVQLAATFKDGPAQLEALKTLHDQTNYVPMTLSTVSGNFFYTAFAAILATGAYTKGKENIAAINADNNGQIQPIQPLPAIPPIGAPTSQMRPK
jgi:hypothetical protein